MALNDREAARLVVVLQDYEHVSASMIDVEGGFRLVVRDHRFALDYEIASHSDYWDFIGALVDRKQYAARPVTGLAA
jgi:hypothetical protein